jgi:hypothetical protein
MWRHLWLSLVLLLTANRVPWWTAPPTNSGVSNTSALYRFCLFNFIVRGLSSSLIILYVNAGFVVFRLLGRFACLRRRSNCQGGELFMHFLQWFYHSRSFGPAYMQWLELAKCWPLASQPQVSNLWILGHTQMGKYSGLEILTIILLLHCILYLLKLHKFYTTWQSTDV